MSWEWLSSGWPSRIDEISKAPIWQQLNRRNPVLSRPQLAKEWSFFRGGAVLDEKLSDRDVAVQTVFRTAVLLGAAWMKTFTPAEKGHSADNTFLFHARNLRYLTAGLRELWGLPEKHVRALERVAAWCETQHDRETAKIKDFYPDDLMVGRHQGFPHVRAYCVKLGQTTRLLYGNVLLETVASIATAALGQSVTKANVRYWCENKKP